MFESDGFRTNLQLTSRCCARLLILTGKSTYSEENSGNWPKLVGFRAAFILYNDGGNSAALLTAAHHAIPLRDTLSEMLSGTSKQQQPVIDDENRHFRTDHLQADLAGRSTRGGAVTLSAQVFKFVFSTVATIVLARMLTPEDYGLIGMVAILVNFVGMFQYLGLSTATVRWAELNHPQVSNLFWMNIGLSVAIMLLTLGSAPLVAWFYHDSRLIGITAGYAVIVLLTGLSIQHEAILMRQMRFGVTAVIEIAAMAIGLGAATIAAWYGAGYWALVLNQFVLALVTIVGVWTACRWRPGLPARGADVRSMLSYGGQPHRL